MICATRVSGAMKERSLPEGASGPRPYDWRHAFAVQRLTDWYHKNVAGDDLEELIGAARDRRQLDLLAEEIVDAGHSASRRADAQTQDFSRCKFK